jgi:hypothetical protein
LICPEVGEMVGIVMTLQSAQQAGVPYFEVSLFYRTETYLHETALDRGELLHPEHAKNAFGFLSKERIKSRPGALRTKEVPKIPSYTETVGG